MIRIFQTTILFICCIFSLNAQMTNTLYFMERIPQSQLLNPATQPKCNVYVGYPGLSSMQLYMGNNSLSLKSFLQKGPNDSLIFFMNKNANKDLFFNDLKDRNSLFFNLQYEVLSFGFRVKSWYFNAGVSLKGDLDLSYSKDFAKLFVNGIKLGDQFSFTNTGFNSTSYAEFALGASKMINEDWTVGAKMKVLRGIANINTHSDNFSLKSVDDANRINQLIIDVDFSMDVNLPNIESTPNGENVSSDSILKTRDELNFKAFENMGLGADFGVTYKGFDKFVLSASIVDLGYIKWGENSQKLRTQVNHYIYKGIDIEIDSFNINFDEISDSIKSAFKFSKSSGSYTTNLPAKFYLAGEYSALPYLSFGALSLTQYYRKEFYQQLMLSANVRPLKMLMFSLSYSIFDNGFSNIGVGTSLRLGPTQFYFISDNIPFRHYAAGIPIPYQLKYISYRFGFNFVFGCDNNKLKDQPLNY